MFNKINKLFDFNQNALNLYAKRQEILSSNIANTDTPNYKAMDINFIDELKNQIKKNNIKKLNIDLQKTSTYHFNIKNKNSSIINVIPVKSKNIKKNGNTVDMNRERIEFISNSIKYRSSLAFINYQIKNMINVIRG